MLCNQVLQGLASSLRALSFDAGRQFRVVVVSFNPLETPWMAAAKKQDALERYHRAGTEAGWHLLTGEPPSLEALTRAVGFRYVFVLLQKLYANASGFSIVTL